MRMLAIIGCILLLNGCGRAEVEASRTALSGNAPSGIVSIDYCADQMLLKLVDRRRIAGVSHEVELDREFSVPRAAGLPRVRPDIESILKVNPAIVVKSYGGGPMLDAQLNKAGIKVVQLGYAATLADIGPQAMTTARALGTEAAGRDMVARLDSQLAPPAKQDTSPSLLYVTPGGVTSGPGSMIDDMIRASGFRNYETRAGWHNLPLEALTRDKPDAVLMAFFDNPAHEQDAWSSARHPLVRQILRDVPRLEVSGASVSCSNWMAGDVVEKLGVLRSNLGRRSL